MQNSSCKTVRRKSTAWPLPPAPQHRRAGDFTDQRQPPGDPRAPRKGLQQAPPAKRSKRRNQLHLMEHPGGKKNRIPHHRGWKTTARFYFSIYFLGHRKSPLRKITKIRSQLRGKKKTTANQHPANEKKMRFWPDHTAHRVLFPDAEGTASQTHGFTQQQHVTSPAACVLTRRRDAHVSPRQTLPRTSNFSLWDCFSLPALGGAIAVADPSRSAVHGAWVPPRWSWL